MNTTLVAGLVAGLLTAAPVPQAAQAHPSHHFRGGCTFQTVNDPLPTEPFGGNDQWTGEATAYIVATTTDTDPSPEINNSTPTPTDSISFECTLWRNGTTNLGTILSGSGTGIASDSDATFTYTAGETDTVQVCEEVTVAGEQHGDSSTFNSAWCIDAETSPIVPQPVQTPIDEALVMMIDVLNALVFEPRSFTVCPGLLALAPTVNTVAPTIIRIQANGNMDLFEEPFWDCPTESSNSHKVHATCRYRNGVITGSATAHSHAGAVTTELHCIARDSNGTVTFDERRLAPGDEATLAGPVGSEPYQLCAAGHAEWYDTHHGDDPHHCTYSRHGMKKPERSGPETGGIPPGLP